MISKILYYEWIYLKIFSSMTKKINSETEKKIKQAAKEIFLKKWLSWSRTREITEKAWVNLALLNYYFWSKDELYNIVIMEMLEEFQLSMFKILDNPKTNFEEKMISFTDEYYNSIVADYRKIPFVLDILRNNIESVRKRIKKWDHAFTKTYFSKQYMEKTWKTMDDFREFFVNFLWLITFPVVWTPLFTVFFEFWEEQYHQFLLKRKAFIKDIIPHLY